MTDTADWSMFPAMPPELQQAIVAAAQKSGMPPALLANHLWNESRGNSSVPAGDGGKSFGVMQIQGPTLADYNAKHGTNYTTADISDPQHPEVGIAVGAQHWADMRDQYNDPRLASLAYAWGPAKTEAWAKAGGDWTKLPPQVREIMGNVYGPSDFPGAAPVPEAVATVQRANTVAAADPFSAAFSGKTPPPALPPAAAAGDTTPTVTVTAKQPAADAFSAAFSGKPAESAAAEPTVDIDPTTGAPFMRQPNGAISAVPGPTTRIGQAVAQGAMEGYQRTPSILTPAAQATVDQGGPVGRWLVNPALRVIGGAAAGANALMSGAAAGVTQAATEAGAPALGRDLNMIAQVTPVAHMGAGVPAVPRGVQEAAPSPRFVQEYYGEGTPQNPLAATPAPASPAFVPPGVNPAPVQPRYSPSAPEPPAFFHPNADATNPLVAEARTNPLSTEPAPQSVGAAASREQTPGRFVDMTPKQVQAYRSTAEGQKLLEPQQPGVADPNIYVPRVTPNAAEIEQTVNTSRELKALNISAPEVSQEAKEVAAANNEARQQYFAKIAGSPVDIQNAVDMRGAQAEKDLAAAFGNKKPADAQPVVDTIRDILTNPRDSENTAVQQYVKPLLGRLMDKDGALKADPEQLYGLREDVARMQSKAAKAETPTLDHVNGQLQQIKDVLDSVIESGAPGYKKYLQNYAEASRPIDTMEVLQGHENKLFDKQNRMTYNQVQTMMRNIVDSRNSPGINPYKSIPDEAMQALWALRDDLRRSAAAQELARTPGSDTTQTMMDTAKGIGKTGANLATHAVLISHFGPAANFVYQSAKNLVSVGAEARAARQRTARGMSLLHPDESRLRNPLEGP